MIAKYAQPTRGYNSISWLRVYNWSWCYSNFNYYVAVISLWMIKSINYEELSVIVFFISQGLKKAMSFCKGSSFFAIITASLEFHCVTPLPCHLSWSVIHVVETHIPTLILEMLNIGSETAVLTLWRGVNNYNSFVILPVKLNHLPTQ